MANKPFKVPAGPTAYFDVDDTLVMWDLPENPPLVDCALIKCRGYESKVLINRYNVDLLKKFAKRGHAVIVWSAGGADWAEAVVKALRLEEYVCVVSGKPSYYIDDISDPAHILGKHGYFDINGNRSATDHLAHRPNFDEEPEYEELKK